jgi:hypothetical protein
MSPSGIVSVVSIEDGGFDIIGPVVEAAIEDADAIVHLLVRVTVLAARVIDQDTMHHLLETLVPLRFHPVGDQGLMSR